MIRVFDAFSGIGGFRSAFERVGGFKTVGWCEIDRFAQKSYRALFDTGGEQFYENIRDHWLNQYLWRYEKIYIYG